MNTINSAPGVEWNSEDTQPSQLGTAMNSRTETTVEAVYPSSCMSCQGELGIDSYCLNCGQKAKTVREYFQVAPAPWVAGVCDIGLVHHRNEDALACQADSYRGVLVVCDGVTTSEDSDVASLGAANKTCDYLWANEPQGTLLDDSHLSAMNDYLRQAMLVANQEVINQTAETSENAAASTIAVAVVDAQAIFCANLGDSRVYWLPDASEPIQLSKDHSLAQDGIDSGAERATAESSVLAHTITKWLGRDSVDLEPFLGTVEVSEPGWVLVCSDGLWNYASEASVLKELVDFLDMPTPEALSQYLVSWACEKGGHDNITVACARIETDLPQSRTTHDETAQTTDTTSD